MRVVILTLSSLGTVFVWGQRYGLDYPSHASFCTEGLYLQVQRDMWCQLANVYLCGT